MNVVEIEICCLFISSITQSSFFSTDPCPSGWTFLENGGCYLAGIEEETSFDDALAYCDENGGILAEPTDSALQSALQSLMGYKEWWIGATVDTESEGNFIWMSGAPWSYTNWNSGEPNDYGDEEDCVVSTSDGKWHNVACGFHNAYPLCQRKGK